MTNQFEPSNFNETKYKDFKLGDPDAERVATIVALCGTGKSILDIGCCDGYIGSKLIKTGNKVSGVDISKTCVDKSKAVGINAKLINLEQNTLPFDEKFDVVVAGEIIEHVTDTDAFIELIKSALKPGGELVISTPNLAALGRRLLLLIGKNPHMEVSFETYSAGHVRYFIKDTLEWLLRKHGFSILEYTSDTVNFNSSGTLASVALAKRFPTLGKSLIIKCKKTD